MGSLSSQTGGFNVSSIAVVGAGPSGIAAAKYLRAEKYFSKIVVFEQRNAVGGIWNTDSSSSAADAAAFPSPIYDGLESNIPSVTMQYSDLPFPDEYPLLPDAAAVLSYLNAYAQDSLSLVRFRTQVVDVRPDGATVGAGSKWKVTTLDLDAGEKHVEVFDAVIVASGRYNKPYIPTIPGLQEWMQAYPEAVLHSKFYRRSEPFKDKKVVIVGYSSSGVDIAGQIEGNCREPLLVSQRSAAGLSPGSLGFAEGKVMLPEIISFEVKDRSVLFANGQEEKDVDKVVFCTGYNYEYPFLSSLQDFEGGKGDGNTETYYHIFYIPNPTLSFVLLPLRVVAFPFAESQAALIARVWSGRLSLPPVPVMEAWVQCNKEKRGQGKGFHKKSFPADADYMNELYNWCSRALVQGEGKGKMPPYWGKKERWLRQRIHEIRRATEARGDRRFYIKHAEDVGFDFEEAKAKAEESTPAMKIAS